LLNVKAVIGRRGLTTFSCDFALRIIRSRKMADHEENNVGLEV